MRPQKSFLLKPQTTQKWWAIDASGQTLGRLATIIAGLLRGKHNPQWTPHVDSGDFVVVTNAQKVHLTGKKWDKKVYYRHSGFVGHLKSMTAREQRDKHPELIIFKAVKGMLPKNTLARKQLTKLKVYKGPDHPHQAQAPARPEGL